MVNYIYAYKIVVQSFSDGLGIGPGCTGSRIALKLLCHGSQIKMCPPHRISQATPLIILGK